MSDFERDTRLDSQALVVFAKPPEPGEVKTRLAGPIDEEDAARLYRAFLLDTGERIVRFCSEASSPISPVLAFANSPNASAFEWFWEHDFRALEQTGENLGARMHRAVEQCVESGARRVVIVGTDSPTLLNRHLAAAFRALETHDVVVGPSFDGGYYLIGLDTPRRSLFEEIDWSTRSVLRGTLRRCHAGDLLCELLEFWYDVDTFDDLRRLRTHLLAYLAREDHTISPRTVEMLRRLERRELFDIETS